MKGKLPISERAGQNEELESQIRAVIEKHAAYAESGPTFDPSGKYLCGECSFRSGTDVCEIVSGKISFTSGSCRLWTTAVAPRDTWPKKLDQVEAQYSERPEALGFGCSRCEYAKDAKNQSHRPLWCGFWGLHVMSLACCSEETGPDLISAPGEKTSTEE